MLWWLSLDALYTGPVSHVELIPHKWKLLMRNTETVTVQDEPHRNASKITSKDIYGSFSQFKFKKPTTQAHILRRWTVRLTGTLFTAECIVCQLILIRVKTYTQTWPRDRATRWWLASGRLAVKSKGGGGVRFGTLSGPEFSIIFYAS